MILVEEKDSRFYAGKSKQKNGGNGLFGISAMMLYHFSGISFSVRRIFLSLMFVVYS